MQCNIDVRGKVVRLISGIVTCAAGLLLFFVAPITWVRGIAAGLVLFGGFQIFEGWAGWCIVRAMGFRTKI